MTAKPPIERNGPTHVRLADGAVFACEVKPDGTRQAGQFLGYVQLPQPTAPAWETALRERCAALGITGDALTATLLHLLTDATAAEIRRMLPGRFDRDKDVKAVLGKALAQLHADGFWQVCREFEQTILLALRGKVNHDARPAGVRGVTPDPEGEIARTPSLSLADVKQSLPEAARIYGTRHRTTPSPAAIAG